MAPALSTRAVALIVLLVNAPVMAQDAGRQADPTGLLMTAASVAAVIPVANPAMMSDRVETAPAWHSIPLAAHTDRIWSFVHTTTVQPAMNLARDSGEWIVSNSSAAVAVAQSASQWLAANAKTMVFSVQDTGEWVVTRSGAALDSAFDAAAGTLSSLTAVEDWSANLVREVESRLRSDGTSEFAILIKESGFALTNIKVGVGIIPELVVEFRHERRLTPDEITAFRTKVDDYARKSAWPVGYFEGLLLRQLSKAGEYSGGMRISELHVDVFPLPGLAVFFDPFRYEEEQNKMLVDAYAAAEADGKSVTSIQERIAKLESAIAALKGNK
jgi:hypothetical protein